MELVVVLALIGIISGAAVVNLKVTRQPLAEASVEVQHFLKLVRARSMSRTVAMKVEPTSSTKISVSSSTSCSGTMAAEPGFFLDLPLGVSLPSTTWSICFTPRGFADSSVSFVLSEASTSHQKTILVSLAGGTREQ